MAKQLAKKWKDYSANKKPLSLLSTEKRREIRMAIKERNKGIKAVAEERREKKKEYIQAIKLKQNEKKEKRNLRKNRQ